MVPWGNMCFRLDDEAEEMLFRNVGCGIFHWARSRPRSKGKGPGSHRSAARLCLPELDDGRLLEGGKEVVMGKASKLKDHRSQVGRWTRLVSADGLARRGSWRED